MTCLCMGCPHPANCRCKCEVCAEIFERSLAQVMTDPLDSSISPDRFMAALDRAIKATDPKRLRFEQ